MTCVGSAPGRTLSRRRRYPAEPGVPATFACGLVDDVPVPLLLGLGLWVGAEGADNLYLETCGFLPISIQPPLRERDLFLPKFNIH